MSRNSACLLDIGNHYVGEYDDNEVVKRHITGVGRVKDQLYHLALIDQGVLVFAYNWVS